MTNQDLIDALASDLAPVSSQEPVTAIAAGLAVGSTVTIVAILALFGVQPGLDTFAHKAPLLMKGAYGLALASMSLALLLIVARPGAAGPGAGRWLPAPVLGLAGIAALELLRLPMSAWPDAMMGASWQQCPWRIIALAVPVFASLCLALRRQAPTDLRTAGAAAGLLSGAVAATAYALACPESSAVFVLVWYTLGIAACTAIGAMLGPKLLRW